MVAIYKLMKDGAEQGYLSLFQFFTERCSLYAVENN